MVFRWPNRCWYGDWVAGLVVLVFGGHGMGCGLLVVWCLLVIGGFFFFLFLFLSLFCWWFLSWWGVCDGGVVVVATLLGMCGYG